MVLNFSMPWRGGDIEPGGQAVEKQDDLGRFVGCWESGEAHNVGEQHRGLGIAVLCCDLSFRAILLSAMPIPAYSFFHVYKLAPLIPIVRPNVGRSFAALCSTSPVR